MILSSKRIIVTSLKRRAVHLNAENLIGGIRDISH